MKRLFSLLLALLMLASAIPFVSAAETLSGQAAAENLHALGLLAGVGKNADGSVNFDVGGKLTRAQAITQIVRFLGAEKTATASTYTHPFTDLPAWAVPYVGYAFENGITKGVSATKFGTDDRMGDAAFLTLILRVLGYKDAEGDFVWNNPYTLAKTAGLIDSETPDGDFTRGDAFVICYRAITATVKSGDSIQEQLIGKGVFTAEQFAAVSGEEVLTPMVPADPETVLRAIGELNKNTAAFDHASDDIAGVSLEINRRETVELSSGKTGHAAYDDAWYPRIKKIRDDLYILFWMRGQFGSDLFYATSTDLTNWSTPQKLWADGTDKRLTHTDGPLAGELDRYRAVNADACVLANGDILAAYAIRPINGYQLYTDLNGIFIKRGTVNADNTITWGEEVKLTSGQAWEPYIWQRPDGNVEIYWSNAVPYVATYGFDTVKRSAGVSMVSSSDNGFTWTPTCDEGKADTYLYTRVYQQYVGDKIPDVADKNYTEAVPYYGGQMPAVIDLADGRSLIAVEVQQLDLNFHISLGISEAGGNWKDLGLNDVGPDERVEDPFDFEGASPYLSRFPSGEVILTYGKSSTLYARMISPDGKTIDDKDFKAAPDARGSWGSVTVMDGHRAIFANPNDIAKLRSVWLFSAYLNHRTNARRVPVSVDGYTNEWNDNTDALFVGSETQAQITVQTAHDDANVYFLVTRLDDYLTEGDNVTLHIAAGKNSYYRVKMAIDGTLTAEFVEGGAVKQTVNGGKAVVKTFGTLGDDTDKDRGALWELSLPKAAVGLLGATSFKLSPQLSNQDGIGAVSDGLTGVSPFVTDRWPVVALD